ncbi:MAG TPA: ATP-binding protein [Vicinamibacterales bacterium]|nr:ATP-binding protein [Vicinamibacterales bacterium]
MNRRSIRVRLTAWYLAVLAPATLALAGGSWWLARRSMTDAADRTLTARLEGTRDFLAGMAREGLSRADMEEEFGEYIELSRGEALLDVREASGRVLSQPSLAGWSALGDDTSFASSGAPAFADRAIGAEPYRAAGATLGAGNATYRIVVASPARAGHDALRRFAWILAALVPGVLLAAGLGGYWIAGRALAPVDRMTRTVQETTLRNLDHRLDVPPADDELRRLATTFNEMLARMQAGVADLTRLTAEASHELRTPVSLVRTTAEVALAQPRSADEYREALSDVLGHAERMSSLVGDLLALARADAGVESGETVPVDLAEVVRDAARHFEAAATQRSLSLTVSAPAPVVVPGDPESLRRLLVILLDNAVKYTPSGGRVDVRLGAADGAAVIHVTDTGIGVDPAERARVFDRFYRGAAARQRAADGSGLGLSIAKTIVERLRGTIALAAGPSGRGCDVVVRLPAVSSQQEGAYANESVRRGDPGRVGADERVAEPAGHRPVVDQRLSR